MSAVDKASKTIKGVSSTIGSLGNAAFKLTGTVSASMNIVKGFASVVGSVGGAIGSTVSEFTKLETALAEVGTITDFTKEEMTGLGNAVSQFSGKYAVEAEDAARGLYQAISAGIPQDSAILFLEEATKFGKGNLAEAGDSVKLLSSTINAYGLETEEASRVADIFTATIANGVTTGAELAASLGQVTPIAAGAGVSLEDMSGAMAVLTKGGLSTAQSATALKAVIQAVVAPTDGAKKAIEDLGLTAFSEAGLKEKGGLFKALKQLTEQGEGTVEELAEVIPSVEALTGVLSMKGQMDVIPEVMAKIQTSSGASAEAFDTATDTFAFRQEQMGLKFKGLMATIGQFIATNPALQAFLDGVGNIIDSVSSGIAGGTGQFSSFGSIISGMVGTILPAMIDGLIYLMDTMAGGTGLSVVLDIVATAWILLETGVKSVINIFRLFVLDAQRLWAVLTFNSEAVAEYEEQIRNVATTMLEDGVEANERLTETWNNGGEATGALADALRGLSADVKAAAQATPPATEAVEGYAEAQDKATDKTKDVKVATQEWVDMLNSPEITDAPKKVEKINEKLEKSESLFSRIATKAKAILAPLSSQSAKLIEIEKEIEIINAQSQARAATEEELLAVQKRIRVEMEARNYAEGEGFLLVEGHVAKALELYDLEQSLNMAKRDTNQLEKERLEVVENFRQSAEGAGAAWASSFSEIWQSQLLDPEANWGEKWSGFTSKIKSDMLNALVDPWLGAEGPVGQFFGGVMSWVSEMSSNLLQSVIDWFTQKQTMRTTDQAAEIATNAATATATTGINVAAGAASTAAWTPAAVMSSIATLGAALAFGLLVSVILSKVIGSFEDGGFITQEQLAMVGEGNKPELVIPLTKPARARDLLAQAYDSHPEIFLGALSGAAKKGGASGGANTFNITVNGAKDPLQTSTAVVDRIDRMLGNKMRGAV